MYTSLGLKVSKEEKIEHYEGLLTRIWALLQGEDDWVAAMATTVCELHHSFEYFDWTGFYRVVPGDLLKIGPYQGGHGCLAIPFNRGVCGKAATTGQTQVVANVHEFSDHIACSSDTNSEIVVPLLSPTAKVAAVLDVDSNEFGAFCEVDQRYLEKLCLELGRRFTMA